MGSGEREEKKRGEGVPRCSTFELEPDKEALDKSRKSSCRCYHHHCAWIVPLLFSDTSLRHCVVPSLFPFLLSRANLLSFDPLQLMECTTFPPALAIFGIRKAHDSICFEIVPLSLSLSPSFFFFLSERKTSILSPDGSIEFRKQKENAIVDFCAPFLADLSKRGDFGNARVNAFAANCQRRSV